MRQKSIRRTLASITAVVLGSTSGMAAEANRSETSVLFYNERDRIKATEAMFSLTRQLKNEFTLNLNLTYDGLTGASPTGGSPSKQPVTVTRSSGGGRIVTPAGALPVDNGFSDTRFGGELSISRKVGSHTTLTAGGRISSEHDYKSIGMTGSIAQEFNEGRTTFSFSGAVGRDKVTLIGGIPEPFADITAPPLEDENGRRIKTGSKSKSTYDLIAGITRIASPRTVLRLNYSLSRASGYLSDPYKIISVVQPADSADPGEPVKNLHEKRPSQRLSNAVFGQIRQGTPFGISDWSYRYFWDDWGVRSHTASISLKFRLGRASTLQPSVRWYQQKRANFSRPFILQGTSLPEYASADNRLAKFSALTYGLNYNLPVSAFSTLVLSAEWYSQSGDPSPPESFGPLLDYNLFPELKALMLRVGWEHDF